MLNWIWLGLILVAVVYAAFTGRMQEVSAATFDGAKEAVELVIGLAGPMILFLGLMRVAQDGGLLLAIARGLKPILRRAFPDVPEDHPAIGAMVMNLASNVLGLGNAATPFGLKAMAELDRLNPRPGVASDTMILFLAINTSAITLFPPTGTMSVRAAAGSSAPEEIWIPTLIATTCSTVAAIAAYCALRRLRPARETAPEFEDEPALGIEPVPDTPDLESTSVRQPAGLRGWLVVGPLDATPELATELTRFARKLGWPLFADALSQLRSGSPERELLVEAHDAVLRASEFAEALLPETVLRFGAMPTSKAYRLLLERHPEITQIVVDPWGWSDPTTLASELVRADPLPLARALASELERLGLVSFSEFGERWIWAGRTARRILQQGVTERAGLSEPGVVYTLAQVLPEGAALFVASSMPVRDVDLFWPGCERSLRVLANRGANGIDGTVSCALGSALGSGTPLVALIGDLALLHDWSGLLLARRDDINATLVVLDNNGGGIFEFLPIASSAGRDVFERHFATGQGVDLCDALRGFGLGVSEARSADELRGALEKSLASPGVQVVVVRTDRRENLELHRKLGEAVARALAPTESG